MNATRHKTYCDICGKMIFTSHARPRDLCRECEKRDAEEQEIIGTTCYHCGEPAMPHTHYSNPRCERHRDV